jgi:hypothetical protein
VVYGDQTTAQGYLSSNTSLSPLRQILFEHVFLIESDSSPMLMMSSPKPVSWRSGVYVISTRRLRSSEVDIACQGPRRRCHRSDRPNSASDIDRNTAMRKPTTINNGCSFQGYLCPRTKCPYCPQTGSDSYTQLRHEVNVLNANFNTFGSYRGDIAAYQCCNLARLPCIDVEIRRCQLLVTTGLEHHKICL